MIRLQKTDKTKIEKIINKHKNEPTFLMSILQEIQKEFGCVCLESQELIADRTDVPISEIYGIVTFYKQFSITPNN